MVIAESTILQAVSSMVYYASLKQPDFINGDTVTSTGFRLFLSFILILIFCQQIYAEEGPAVNEIVFKGIKRIEDEAVRKMLSQKSGERLSREAVANDIKRIYQLGYFEDVRAEVEPFEGGLRLIYLMKEKSTIVRVSLEGNKEFDDDKLSEEINITTGTMSDTTLIRKNIRLLKDFYDGEGYWFASIIPIISQVGDGESALTILIDEGKKVRIKKINIEGNQALSNRKVKGAMKTKSWWIFSFLTASWNTAGFYKKSEMEADIERIKELYYNHGFLNVKIGDPEIKLTANRRKMMINIPISEGPRYKLGSVTFEGNTFDNKSLRELMPLKDGKTFSRKKLGEGIRQITEFYTERGYAMASVVPGIVPDEKTQLVKLQMRISEKDIYRIGRIGISGNTKTQDKVIRREMRLDEGDIFNSKLLKRSYERLNILNYFETIDLLPKPRVKDKEIDLDIRVKEKATGMLSLGGGYSTVNGLSAMLDIQQSNLFGTGRHLKLGGTFSAKSTQYNVKLTDQWFLDRPLSLSLNIFKTTNEFDSYDKKSTGGAIGLGKRFGEYWSANITYRLEMTKILNVASDADTIIKNQEGDSTSSSITPTIVRDTRDSHLDPTRGSRNSIFITYSGLGGDNKFYKGVFDSGWFFPVWKTTVSLHGKAGYAAGLFGDKLPISERFYVGGIRTVRGLSYGEAGPRGSDNKVKGGTKELILNAEYIIPISTKAKLKGVLFFDAGRGYDTDDIFGTDLRYTAGGELRWFSPMGPIRMAYGFNLDRRSNEEAGKAEFTFGTMF